MHAKVNFYAMKIGEHPNVLKFIGVVDDDVRKYIIHCDAFPLLQNLNIYHKTQNLDHLNEFSLELAFKIGDYNRKVRVSSEVKVNSSS